jgi:hypothetical protein
MKFLVADLLLFLVMENYVVLFVFVQSFTTTTTSKFHLDFGIDHVLNPKSSLSLSLFIYTYTHNHSILLLVTPTGFIVCTSLLMFAVCANPL